MEAIYFNGQSSKPYKVTITKSSNGIQILSTNQEDGINRFWQRANISSKSMSTSQKILLSYGDFPPERLEITGVGADNFMEYSLAEETAIKKSYYQITRANPLKLVIGSALALGLVIYSYVYHISPFVGEKAVVLVPKEIEAKVGEKMYGKMASFVEVDEAKSAKLLAFFEACGFESEYPIRIDYGTNDMVNAFAVPGGQIVVFEGILNEMESWEELAALLGHELAHVNQRHSFQQIARSVSSYLLLSVLTGDVAGASSVFLEQASQINEMANSRIHEKEADVVGLEYLKNNSIRPTAMKDLFKRLMDASGESEGVASAMEILSTHPLSSKRIEYIQEIIDTEEGFDYEGADILEAREIFEELMFDIGNEPEEEDDIFLDVEEMLEKENE